MDLIEVTARFAKDGNIYPQRLNWQGVELPVESTGRHWQDQEGIHILVMVPRERVLELIYHTADSLWYLKQLPAGRHLA